MIEYTSTSSKSTFFVKYLNQDKLPITFSCLKFEYK